MTTLASYEDLLWTYRTPIADTFEGFRKKYQETLDAELLDNGIVQDTTDEKVNQRRADISAGVFADMAADTGGYKALAADTVTNYTKGNFTKEDAVSRTNKVLGTLAGLRSFLEHGKPIPLSYELCEELDEQVEEVMQEITTNLAEAIKSKDYVNITFDVKGDGLTI